MGGAEKGDADLFGVQDSKEGTMRYKRAWATLAPVILLWMVVGCGPASLAMMLMPFSDDKEEPKCKLANPDKEVTIVLACHFQNLEVRPELMSADQQLVDSLATELNKRYKDNKEKVKIVPPTRVRGDLMKLREWDPPSLREVAEKYNADYLIAIDIQKLSLVMRNSYDTLFNGQVDLHVRVFDIHAPILDGYKYENYYHQSGFPQNRPIDASNSSPDLFRGMFVEKMSKDLAKWFAAYPSDDKYEMGEPAQ
jgi:hypothetical protein